MNRKALLGNTDIRADYGLGRDLATRLARLLPHIKAGRSGRGDIVLVKREDLERLLNRAKAERLDLWDLSRTHTPESFEAWLNGEVK